jgi:hypothetical protein
MPKLALQKESREIFPGLAKPVLLDMSNSTIGEEAAPAKANRPLGADRSIYSPYACFALCVAFCNTSPWKMLQNAKIATLRLTMSA